LPPLQILIPSFVILVMSLSIHEAAHAWTADRLGDSTARRLGRLTINPLAHIDWIGTVLFPLIAMYSGLPLIGWAKPVPVNWQNLRAPRKDFAIIAAAGPISNLVIAVSAAVVLTLVPGGDTALSGAPTLAGMLVTVVILNVLLAVFNMIPVPPLDGGNVISGFVPESVARAIDQMRPFGFLILYGLLITGFLGQITQPFMRSILRWLL
jgi:Zn-dependent protease